MLPIVLGIACWVFGVQIRGADTMLNGVSIYSALLFGLLVQVFQMKVRLMDQQPRNEAAIEINRQLEANTSYAILIGIVTTGVLLTVIATTDSSKPVAPILSGLIVLLLTHLLMTLFMVLKRARAIYGYL